MSRQLPLMVPYPSTPGDESTAPPTPSNKLLVDVTELAQLTSLSVRTLRRMDASRDLPGRVVVGRRVLFQLEEICAWVRAGLPGRDLWAALQKRNGKR